MRAEEGEEVDLENALAGLILCVCTYYRGDCCTTSSKPWCFALFTICINPHVSSDMQAFNFSALRVCLFSAWRSQPCKGVGSEGDREGLGAIWEKLSEDCKIWLWSERFCIGSVFVAGPSGLLPHVRYSCRDRTAFSSQSWDLNLRILLLLLEAAS